MLKMRNLRHSKRVLTSILIMKPNYIQAFCICGSGGQLWNWGVNSNMEAQHIRDILAKDSLGAINWKPMPLNAGQRKSWWIWFSLVIRKSLQINVKNVLCHLNTSSFSRDLFETERKHAKFDTIFKQNAVKYCVTNAKIYMIKIRMCSIHLVKLSNECQSKCQASSPSTLLNLQFECLMWIDLSDIKHPHWFCYLFFSAPRPFPVSLCVL